MGRSHMHKESQTRWWLLCVLLFTCDWAHPVPSAAPLNFQLLHTFGGGSAGQGPQLPMLRTNDGNLYGSALGREFGYELIFRIDQAGQFSVAHQFRDGSNDAGGNCVLIQGGDGFIYGASESKSGARMGAAHAHPRNGQPNLAQYNSESPP